MPCAAAGALAAVAERIVEVAANDLEGGRETEDDGGECGDGQSEGEDREIEPDDGFGGNDSRRYECDEAFESTPGEEGAEDGSADREEKAFDEELANDAPATGTKRGADGELFFTGSGASEEQICNVAAADEKQETYSAEDNI